MPQTSRERVSRCLTFQGPDRVPRMMWTLPWAQQHYPEAVRSIHERFPGDLAGPANVYRRSARVVGDCYALGKHVDEWGCVFHNIQQGVHGEVSDPLLPDIRNWKSVRPPCDVLPENEGRARDAVNRSCAESDGFVLAGCNPRPWERYQFLRGSVNALMDCAELGRDALNLLGLIHDFYLRECEFWVSTDVDAVSFSDDWGSQRQLLIPPAVWREIFKPLYKDYCDMAHARGKRTFMHSDGYISEIYEDLVEIGVDAINSQLFCMDMADLARRLKGRITFYGEIDRQHVLTSSDPEVGRKAVREVVRHFYDPAGGVIAQFEFGVGTHPATAMAIFEEWERIGAQAG